jgi:hypothetical protein
MRIICILLALTLLAPISAVAQFSLSSFPEESATDEAEETEDEIETDRDSFTPTTTTAGRHRLIVESAYTFIDNRRVPETHSFPELIVRYGATNWLEFRIGANYEIGGAGNPVTANIPDNLVDESELEEEANVSYGLKLTLTGQDGWIPQTAFLMHGFTPIASEIADTHMAATYVAGWTVDAGRSWDSALRFSTGSADEDHFTVWSPSTVLKVPIAEQWKAHIEYFGIFSDGRDRESTQHFISPGAHYLITPDWELGIRVGWGLNDQSPSFFANVGGGYRF